MRLAYISPLNPIPSGISDYSEILIPVLSEYFHITLYSDCGVPANPLIARQFRVYPVSHLQAHRSHYDLRLYQVGNSPHHKGAFAALRYLPGIVVLHEPFLHHGLHGVSPVRFYRRELFYDMGKPDRISLMQMERLLVDDRREQMVAVPLIGRVLDSSIAIIVHSQTARKIIESYSSSFSRLVTPPRVKVIPHLMQIPGPYNALECRLLLGLPADDFVVGVMGIIHPIKEPSMALRAFALLAEQVTSSRLIIAGEIYQGADALLKFVDEQGIADKVTILGRLEPLERLHEAIAACDVLLCLRRTTVGETSGITLRAMALGKPVIVRNTGWFSELPDDACVKIEPEDGAEKLAAVMRTLASSPEMRHRIGQKARDYVRHTCDPLQVARQYAEFLQDVYLSIANP